MIGVLVVFECYPWEKSEPFDRRAALLGMEGSAMAVLETSLGCPLGRGDDRQYCCKMAEKEVRLGRM